MTETKEVLSKTDKDRIAETAEEILREDFTSRPGWNWPASKASRLVATVESPDEEGDLEIWVVVKRINCEDDDD